MNKRRIIKYNRGTISLPIILSGAGILLTMTAGVFGWTYTQFSSVTAHANTTDIKVAANEQKTTDIDDRLTRIENKLDMVIQSKIK